MVMDYRRSCSKSRMVISRPGEPRVEIPVIWYWAPEGAKVYPYANSFGSGVWDRDHVSLPPQIGEQPPYAQPYYGGKNVWGYSGQCCVGTPEQFWNGLSPADLTAAARPTPACCGGGIPTIGGIVEGSFWQQPVLPDAVAVDLLPVIPPFFPLGRIGFKLGWGGTAMSSDLGVLGIGFKLGWRGTVIPPTPVSGRIGFKLGVRGGTGSTLQNGILAWWGCHESAGTNRLDASGNGKTMFQQGGSVGDDTGLIGQAAWFNATTSLICATTSWTAGAFSFSLWYYADVSSPGTPLSQNNGNDGTIQLTSTDESMLLSGIGSVGTGVGVTVSTWTHLVFSYDGTDFRVYRNGDYLGIFNSPGETSSASAIGLGNFNGLGANFFGRVQLVGYWNRALTDGGVSIGSPAAGEVAELYGSGSGNDWPF